MRNTRQYPLGTFVTHAGRQKLSMLLTVSLLLAIFSLSFRFFPNLNLKGVCFLFDLVSCCIIAGIVHALAFRPRHDVYIRASMLAHQREERGAARARQRGRLTVRRDGLRQLPLRRRLAVVTFFSLAGLLALYVTALPFRVVPALIYLAPDGVYRPLPTVVIAAALLPLALVFCIIGHYQRFRVADSWDESLERLLERFRPFS